MNRRGFLKLLGLGGAGVVGAAVLPARSSKRPSRPRLGLHRGLLPAFTFSGNTDTGMYRSTDFAIGVTGWKLTADD